MNKIEKLIKDLCPNGVKYKKLTDVTELSAGARITKAMMMNDNEYPVVGGGILPTGFYYCYNREHCITISRAGSAGFVNWQEQKFWATDVCFTAIQKFADINIKFVYYCLKNAQSDLQEHIYGGSMPKLEKNYLWNYLIPIPPLKIQNEIVKILDEFVKLEVELEAQLEAELEARKKQYNFYRARLLEGHTSFVKLNEVCNSIKSGKNSNRTQEGKYSVYGSTGLIAKSDNYAYDNEQILVARVGANAGLVNIVNGKYDVSDNALILDVNSKYNLRYIYYYLVNLNLNKYTKGGGQPLLTGGQLKLLEIPVPSLEVQRRIVNILDKFDKLANDIKDGLPAEIEMRRKQYEYYRNKLLSFEEVKHEQCKCNI